MAGKKTKNFKNFWILLWLHRLFWAELGANPYVNPLFYTLSTRDTLIYYALVCTHLTPTNWVIFIDWK
jgi:hypothetical protein